jgi:hypothetical protein
MNAWQRVAQRALARSGATKLVETAHVERLRIDVRLNEQLATVDLRLQGDKLEWTCSCGLQACDHVTAALVSLGDADLPAQRLDLHVAGTEVATIGSDRRTLAPPAFSTGANRGELAEALQDLITAVVRSGAQAGLSASVEDALARLVGAAPSPLPLGVSRWIGRLKACLGAQDLHELARLLAGAALLVDDFGANAIGDDSRMRVTSWLGPVDREADVGSRPTDITLIEIAREHVAGASRAGVERRYMVDLQSGRIYREERQRGAQDASLGPCPRVLTVWLASVDRAPFPERIRVHQYAVTPIIEAATFCAIQRHAMADFTQLAAAYRGSLETYPGLCEPFVLLAPARVSLEDGVLLFDRNEQPLPLLGYGGPEPLRAFARSIEGAETMWVAGRLVDREGVLSLVLLSSALLRRGQVCYAQM